MKPRLVTITVDVAELGRKGGTARAANLKPEERSEAARHAAKARWDREKARKEGR